MRARALRTAALAAAVATAELLPMRAYAADYQVYSPNIVLGEQELEARSFSSWGTGPQTGSERGLKLAYGRAFTPWWATEVYATAEQEYGETLKLEEFEWENRFQLTPQGKYWVDVGLLNENEIPRYSEDPYEIKLGPTFEKDVGRFTTLLDVLAARQYGSNAAPGVELEYRARLEYRWRRTLSPLIEAYGQPVGRIGAYGRARNQIGPGVTGQFLAGAGHSLRYAVVALFGASRAAPNATLVLRLEYEFY